MTTTIDELADWISSNYEPKVAVSFRRIAQQSFNLNEPTEAQLMNVLQAALGDAYPERVQQAKQSTKMLFTSE